MRGALVVLAVGGCYNPSPPAGVPCGENDTCPAGQACIAGVCAGTAPGEDANTGDSAPAIDAPALCTTWNARHFDPCMLPAPMGDLVLTTALSGYTWNTSKPELKGKANTTIPVTTIVMPQEVGPELLVASVNNFSLEAGASLDLDGTRALLIAVWGAATIEGTIDVSASFTIPGPGGAGAATTSLGCGPDPTGNFGTPGTPPTGGGGGALQGAGGSGGNLGGAPGAAMAASTRIQGGCAGGGGGAGTNGQGSRGAGGGAIQITARESITVTADGVIHAGGGAGGYGRSLYGAGGGGGAGGYIGIDAQVVTIAGTLAANGGSGGGGASDLGSGSSGTNGRADGNPAIGGAGASASSLGACPRGGNGSSGGTLSGADGGTSACGGGGGGGGAGYILIWSPMLSLTGTVSPPVTGGP